MNFRSKLGLALYVFLLSFAPLSSQTDKGSHYCNDAFQFCAFYPEYLFADQSELPGKNGIVLKSQDGYVEMTIAVWPLSEETSSEDLFLSSAKSKSALTGKSAKVINSIFGEDFYECYFLVDVSYYYQKCFQMDGYYVLLELRTPINMPDKMQVIRPQVGLDFLKPAAPVPDPTTTGSVEEVRLKNG